MGDGDSRTIADIVPLALDRMNGCTPASSSYSRMPKAKMSERSSASPPRSCSGDM